MKRGCEIDATRHKRAAMVRLNVGGMRFDTTRDTLAHCEYVVAYLSGRMSHAEDSAGRLFIDRGLPSMDPKQTYPARSISKTIGKLNDPANVGGIIGTFQECQRILHESCPDIRGGRV